MVILGRFNTLRVAREADVGLYLDGENLGEILLPRRPNSKRSSRGF